MSNVWWCIEDKNDKGYYYGPKGETAKIHITLYWHRGWKINVWPGGRQSHSYMEQPLVGVKKAEVEKAKALAVLFL
jgi:hypothetical protein